MRKVQLLEGDWLVRKMKAKNQKLLLNSPHYHIGKLRQALIMDGYNKDGQILKTLENLEIAIENLKVVKPF